MGAHHRLNRSDMLANMGDAAIKLHAARTELPYLLRQAARPTRVRHHEDLIMNTVEAFRNLREHFGVQRIGYVSGIISSDGPDFHHTNLRLLGMYTRHYRDTTDFPVFSYMDLYNRKTDAKLGPDQKKWAMFWTEILSCGYPTDIFMTPRWTVSGGAKVEHTVSKDVGLKIYNHNRHPMLVEILNRVRPDVAAELMTPKPQAEDKVFAYVGNGAL